jgi:RNA polymerase sigma factor (sigma-70 family)
MDVINHRMQEDAVWKSLREGRESAFDAIYTTYFPKLYSYGVRICQDKDLVKDCIQTLFVEIWHKKEHLSEVSSVKYYLFKSLRRKLVRELTQQHKFKNEQELEENYTFEVTFSHEFLLISEQVSQENIHRLMNAFQFLTQRQKEAIFLRFYENLEYEQIAVILSLKEVKYARTLVYRAIDVLKSSIRKLATT